MFEPGSILLAKNYQLPTKVKDKFFIVLGTQGNRTILLAMTTSQIYFDSSLIKHGVIKDRDMSVYCFEKDRVIGKNGFSFHKNTIVSQRFNILPYSAEKIKSLNMEYMDCLTKEEIINLVYSFYTYAGVQKKYIPIFENILHELIEEV